MSHLGQFSEVGPRKRHVRFPPLATRQRTSLEVRLVPVRDMSRARPPFNNRSTCLCWGIQLQGRADDFKSMSTVLDLQVRRARVV